MEVKWLPVYWYWYGNAWYPYYVDYGHYDVRYHKPFLRQGHYDTEIHYGPDYYGPCFDVRHFPYPHYDTFG